MELSELESAALAQLKKDGAVLLENQVALLMGPAMELALSKLKAAIPGTVDDTIIDMVAPKLIELIKAEVAAQLAKLQAL